MRWKRVTKILPQAVLLAGLALIATLQPTGAYLVGWVMLVCMSWIAALALSQMIERGERIFPPFFTRE